jgi:Protein of unknown function (DUF2752)
VEREGDVHVRIKRNTLWGALAWGTLIVAFGGVIVVSFVVSPEDIASGAVWLSPECPMRLLLHRECPTCGMTRAFAAIGHGQWNEALGYNRAAPIVFFAFVAAIIFGLLGLYRSIDAYRHASTRRTT